MYATHLSRTRDFRLWSLSDERQNACNTLSVLNVRAATAREQNPQSRFHPWRQSRWFDITATKPKISRRRHADTQTCSRRLWAQYTPAGHQGETFTASQRSFADPPDVIDPTLIGGCLTTTSKIYLWIGS